MTEDLRDAIASESGDLPDFVRVIFHVRLYVQPMSLMLGSDWRMASAKASMASCSRPPTVLAYSRSRRATSVSVAPAPGTISAAGTLGQIIPPSIILIILGDVFQEPVGDLFKAALWPGLSLVGFYTVYIVIVTLLKKDLAPPIRLEEMTGTKKHQVWQALKAVVPPLVLIVLVLGSILTGVATPTESSSVGGVGAILLAAFYGRFSVRMVWESSLETVKINFILWPGTRHLVVDQLFGQGVMVSGEAFSYGKGSLLGGNPRRRIDQIICRYRPAHTCRQGLRLKFDADADIEKNRVPFALAHRIGYADHSVGESGQLSPGFAIKLGNLSCITFLCSFLGNRLLDNRHGRLCFPAFRAGHGGQL